MKTYTTFIESFTKPYVWGWNTHESDPYYKLAFFKTDTESEISIEFELLPDEETWDVGFSRDGSYKARNEGDAFRIFATVMDCMMKFIKEEEPIKIKFTADKSDAKNRARLYARMAKKYVPTGYAVSTKTSAKGTVFSIKKK